mmetsp:Transcript_70156/g.121458  ORF Transcript_70156/g.121458 Transcript_70156/m.121458 type:complete len:226 (-) Transcript_70156:151-828(-)
MNQISQHNQFEPHDSGNSLLVSAPACGIPNCRCFLSDTLFRTLSGQFIPAHLMQSGSQVLGADGEEISVTNAKITFEQSTLVELRTSSACLLVTATHHVVVHNATNYDRVITMNGQAYQIVRAGRLKTGDEVLCSGSSVQPLVNVQQFDQLAFVVQIEFSPDKPVETSPHPASSILSMGHQRPRTRRSGMNRRFQRNAQPSSASQDSLQQHDDAVSIPATDDSFF